jgi:hypothetical protein
MYFISEILLELKSFAILRKKCLTKFIYMAILIE